MLPEFFFILVSSFLILVSPIYALDPIIITNPVTHSPPPPSQQPPLDITFYSNDADLNNTVTCSAPVTICQSFQPKCGKKDDNGDCIRWISYDVTRIQGDVSFGLSPYQNEWYRRTYYHFANHPKGIGDSSFLESMTSYDTLSPSGANNAFNRLYPEPVLSCLKGQRLYKAVQSLTNLDSTDIQAVANEAVAWTDGISVADTPTRPDLKPVRLVDIALAMAKAPLDYRHDCQAYGIGETVLTAFYNPTQSCFGSTLPEPEKSPPPAGGYKPVIGDPYIACRLFQHAVEVTDISSNARIIRVKDDEQVHLGYSLIPLGNLSTNIDITSMLRPANATVAPVDICRIAPSVETTDKANAITFTLVGLQNIFGTVVDTPKTFCKTFTRTYKMDKRIPDTFANYNVTLQLFMPSSYIVNNNLMDVPMGSEDGRGAYDPGNGRLEKYFYDLLRPVGMQ